MSGEVLLRAIERAAVHGWPALEAREIDGWVWRYASGGSIRANTVAALSWHGHTLDRSIDACEALYRAKGAPSAFTISEVSAPVDLDRTLESRGYIRGDDHVTMAKVVSSAPHWPEEASTASQPSEAWMGTYLSGLSEDRRGVARQLIANLPGQAQFVGVGPDRAVDLALAQDVKGQLPLPPCGGGTGRGGLREDAGLALSPLRSTGFPPHPNPPPQGGREPPGSEASSLERSDPCRAAPTLIASTGLTIVDGTLASVQCMATLLAHRRQGGARHVLAAIEAHAYRRGATHLYLQTGGDNIGAQALYTRFGFSIVGRYHTRTRHIT